MHSETFLEIFYGKFHFSWTAIDDSSKFRGFEIERFINLQSNILWRTYDLQLFVQPLSMLGTTSYSSTGVLLGGEGGGVTFKNEGGGAFKCHLNVGGRVKEKQFSCFQVCTLPCPKLQPITVKQQPVVNSDKRCHFYLFYASLLFGIINFKIKHTKKDPFTPFQKGRKTCYPRIYRVSRNSVYNIL